MQTTQAQQNWPLLRCRAASPGCRFCWAAIACLFLICGGGCRLFHRPSNNRDWSPDVAVLPKAEQHGELVTVRNIRDFNYMSEDDYVVNYYDRTYDLRQLKTVDFIIVPFTEWSG